MSFSGDITSVAPTSVFSSRSGETARPSYVPSKAPVQTNNFYANLLLEDHDQPVVTNPYKLSYTSTGINIYYPLPGDLVYGPDPVKYFYYPNKSHLTLTSADFSSAPAFAISSLNKFMATTTLSNSVGKVTTPLIQGMGLVTCVYDELIPQITSTIGFKSVTGKTCQNSALKKFEIKLDDGTTYTLFLNKSIAVKSLLSKIVFEKGVSGLILQVGYGSFAYYDQIAGCYPSDVSLSTTSSSYTLSYTIKGSSLTKTTLIFAPPHMVSNFTSATKKSISNIAVNSCTLGTLTGCIANSLLVSVSVPGTKFAFKKEAVSALILLDLVSQANKDMSQDIASETNQDSMYYSGKKFLKYALLAYIVKYIIKDDIKAKSLLAKIISAYNVFITNKQKHPLFYDTNFKGIVSSATGNDDFGNGHYNDHHFHYGYHIYAVALLIKVDNAINGGKFKNTVKDWIELLIMDVFNINRSNSNFPFIRNFDFYNGHSWAKGLYASGDGKDEESSSEDYTCYYGIKLYGNVTGNSNLEQCANLVLGIMKTSFNDYFYYENNSIMPSKFVYNKVSGIYFENKVDHTTYFGNYESYIHGIHMIPLTPISPFFRGTKFVTDEWSAIKGDLTQDNWMSTLMMNYSLIDASGAYDFFKNQWQSKFLDDGLSLTYCLFYCAQNM